MPADAQLIEQIQQATRGGSRVLCTLARRGKAIERDEPQRAQHLLVSVLTHPLYKGGRLAFDMLELEDLILECSTVDSIDTSEFIQVISAGVLGAGVHNLIGILRRIGSDAEAGRVITDESVVQSDPLDRADAIHAPVAATALPRVSFGSTPQTLAGALKFNVSGEAADGAQREPELRASDYLYDYVVLGFLDVIGRTGMSE